MKVLPGPAAAWTICWAVASSWAQVGPVSRPRKLHVASPCSPWMGCPALGTVPFLGYESCHLSDHSSICECSVVVLRKRVICGHQHAQSIHSMRRLDFLQRALTFIGHDCILGPGKGWRKHPKVYPKIFPKRLEMCAFGDVESWHLGIFPKHGIESWVHNDFPNPPKKHQGINK